jgi:hypothetical protein
MTKRMPNESAQNKAELAYTTSPFYFVSRLLFRHDALSLHVWTQSDRTEQSQGWMICCLQQNHVDDSTIFI